MARFRQGSRAKSGLSSTAHITLTILLPVLVYVLVRIDFVPLAIAVVLLSKWRMFAVRMRYWPAHLRANAVDIMVGLSIVIFMASTLSEAWQLAWAVVYGLWLFFIKPKTGTFMVSLQAAIGMGAGLTAGFLAGGSAPLVVLVIMSWAVCYLSARHFLVNFEEPHTSLYSHFWGYFAACLTWITGHWLLFYAFGYLAQPTLLLLVMGYGMATMYYLYHNERLSPAWGRQLVVMMVIVVAVILTFSDWGDKAL